MLTGCAQKQPKAEIRILDMNVVFAHNKLPTPTSLQISYLHNGTTRHIYVYHEEAEVLHLPPPLAFSAPHTGITGSMLLFLFFTGFNLVLLGLT